MNKRVLIMMIGIPASGKTMLADQISDRYMIPIVSSDKVRQHLYGDEAIQGNSEKVFNEIFKQINFWIECGACIYDATNVRKIWRYAAVAKTLPSEIVYIVINTKLERALLQNKNRERQVPNSVIYRMNKYFQNEYPQENECKNLKIFNYDDPALLDYLEEL